MHNTRPLVRTALLGSSLAIAVALSGCSSDAGPSDASGSTQQPTPSTSPSSTPSVSTSATASTTPAGTTSASATASTSTVAALSKLGLRKRDLPSTFESGAVSRIDGIVQNRTLRTCIGLGTAQGVLGRLTSPTFSAKTSGAASIVSRYRTDADRDSDVAVLRNPKAEKCFTALFVDQNKADGGSPVKSTTAEIRPGTNDGPSNEAGVASVNLVVDEDGRGSRQTVSFAVYYLTGPRTLTQLIFQGYGKEFDGTLSTKVLTTLAARTAGA